MQIIKLVFSFLNIIISLKYKFITTKSSGWIETLDSNVKLGKIPAECVAFLKNAEHEEVLTSLLSKVEPYWEA